MKTAVYRKDHFCATHRLHNPKWDDAMNEKVFGKCNNPNFHGHNYELIVKVVGEVDPEIGFVIDAKVLKDIIRRKVVARYDHKNLYTDVDDFSNLNPTAENIARQIYKLIREELSSELLLQVRLYETSNIFVEYPAFIGGE